MPSDGVSSPNRGPGGICTHNLRVNSPPLRYFSFRPDQYTVLESNQPTGLRRPSAAAVGRCKRQKVREEGFEPAASRSQAERSTELSYTLIEPVGKTGVEPAFSCFRRARPLHLAHFPISFRASGGIRTRASWVEARQARR